METFFMKINSINYFIVAVQIIMLILSSVSAASEAQIEEYTLKAVYIEKFTRFIEWPKESGIDDTWLGLVPLGR
ncbi:exported hypothetical protein [Candidatus Sulfobium mesophilum]|uniref:Uncharacterized protein n=1 Tax=Candidatus Sulfobium mesophilum TaxID=2016548 RepID=A0A2U3QH71_9BACT|nr:exported hypothetical protein [Candidatus Sulfobium mesophilum]